MPAKAGSKPTTARSIWHGAIVFGMLSVPVKLYSAQLSQDLSFTWLHNVCMTQRKQRFVCATCEGNPEVEKDDLVRAFEFSKSQFVEVTDEELAALPVPSKNSIDVSAFIPMSDIDPIYYEKAYWIEPEPAGVKPYAMLAKAMRERDRVAIGKLTLRNKEQLVLLRPAIDDTIIVESLLWPDEVRPLNSGTDLPSVSISKPEMEMALMVVDNFTERFDPSNYSDEYRSKLLEMVNTKAAGGVIEVTPAEAAPPPTIDLMAALQATLAAKKKEKSA